MPNILSPFASRKKKEKREAEEGPGSAQGAQLALNPSPAPPPPRVAGRYGEDTVFGGKDSGGTPAFSNRLNDPLLAGGGPKSRANEAASTVDAPTMGEGVAALQNRQQYQTEVRNAGDARDRGDIRMRQNAIRRASGQGFDRMDDIRTPGTPEEAQLRMDAALMSDEVAAQKSDQDFVKGRDEQALKPPPHYVTGRGGDVSLVEGTRAQPVRGPEGKPLVTGQPAKPVQDPAQAQYLDLVKALMPSADELRGASVGDNPQTPDELIRSRIALASELMGQAAPDSGASQAGQIEKPQFEGAELADGEQGPDKTGRWWMRVGEQLYQIDAPTPRR